MGKNGTLMLLQSAILFPEQRRTRDVTREQKRRSSVIYGIDRMAPRIFPLSVNRLSLYSRECIIVESGVCVSVNGPPREKLSEESKYIGLEGCCIDYEFSCKLNKTRE